VVYSLCPPDGLPASALAYRGPRHGNINIKSHTDTDTRKTPSLWQSGEDGGTRFKDWVMKEEVVSGYYSAGRCRVYIVGESTNGTIEKGWARPPMTILSALSRHHVVFEVRTDFRFLFPNRTFSYLDAQGLRFVNPGRWIWFCSSLYSVTCFRDHESFFRRCDLLRGARSPSCLGAMNFFIAF